MVQASVHASLSRFRRIEPFGFKDLGTGPETLIECAHAARQQTSEST